MCHSSLYVAVHSCVADTLSDKESLSCSGANLATVPNIQETVTGLREAWAQLLRLRHVQTHGLE